MPQTHSYEFTEPQNRTLTRLARSMRWTGILSIAIAVCAAVVTLAQASPPYLLLAYAALLLVVGIGSLVACGHFQNIVDTRGSDVGHLFAALGRLRAVFVVQAAGVGGALLLVLVAFVLALGPGAAPHDAGPGASPTVPRGQDPYVQQDRTPSRMQP